MAKYAAITGWGMAVPERVLTNAELERMVSTSDEWIQTRTGIRERRVVGSGESTSTLSTDAGRRALERAGLAASEIDLIILATCTPDRPFPATACTERGRRAGTLMLRCSLLSERFSHGPACGPGVRVRPSKPRSPCPLFGHIGR